MIDDERVICRELLTYVDGALMLLGNQCAACGEIFFPKAPVCAKCLGNGLSEMALGSRGRIWSWTMQLFKPKEPYDGADLADFNPYGVGYVELACGIKIESRLRMTLDDPLKIDDRVRLELEPYCQNFDGQTRLTFAFGRERQS